MSPRKREISDPYQAYQELCYLLEKLEYLVDAVVVEGLRDVEALQRLGFKGRVEGCSKVRVSDSDFVESLARDVKSVAILTDFDEEGRRLNNRLTSLLQRRGVKVETGLRRELSRLMAVLGVYAVEALDNVALES